MMLLMLSGTASQAQMRGSAPFNLFIVICQAAAAAQRLRPLPAATVGEVSLAAVLFVQLVFIR